MGEKLRMISKIDNIHPLLISVENLLQDLLAYYKEMCIYQYILECFNLCQGYQWEGVSVGNQTTEELDSVFNIN